MKHTKPQPHELDIPEFLKRSENDPPAPWVPPSPAPSVAPKPKSEMPKLPDMPPAPASKTSKKKPKSPDPKTHHWDTVHNCWRPNQIYNTESKMRLDFSKMDPLSLTQVYNEMAQVASGLGIPVNAQRGKFPTKEDGISRCEGLYRAICISRNESYEEPSSPVPNIIAPDEEKSYGLNKSKKAKLASVNTKSKEKEKAKAKSKSVGKPISSNPMIAEMGVRAGTLHEKIALFLGADSRIGKQVPEQAIIKHAYDNDPKVTKTNRIKDLMRIVNSTPKCKYEIRKEETANSLSYGLYKK